MGFVWVHAASFFHAGAGPFHSCVSAAWVSNGRVSCCAATDGGIGHGTRTSTVPESQVINRDANGRDTQSSLYGLTSRCEKYDQGVVGRQVRG